MQIVESSFIGLRSARIELASDTCKTRITLFPMAHVGESAFFEQVASDALAHDLVLIEGVGGRVARRLTRVYRWAGVSRLGLMQQPKLAVGGHVRNADLSSEAFEQQWAKVPFATRVLYTCDACLRGIWIRLTGSRERLARHLIVDDLTSREDHLAGAGKNAPILWALIGARDACVINHLDAALHQNAHNRIAVVFGASHIPALLRHLSDAHNYAPTDNTWMTVFSL